MATHKNTAPAAAHSEVPAVIAGSGNLMRFSEAIARAGLVGRHDAGRGVLVIESAQSACRSDAEVGMACYNRLGRTERLRWHRLAGSAVPADAWRTFQSGGPAS